jgi:aspartyl protease family protein
MTIMNAPAPNTKPLGKAMIIASWVLVLGLLTLFFSNWEEQQHNPNQEYLSQTTAQGVREIILQRNRYGHYVANGLINGQQVVFMLDTGATIISIPEKTARRLQLKAGTAFPVQTANGTIQVYSTRLDQLDMGDIVLHDLRATINPHMQGEEILLGMNVLKTLEMIQRDKTLTLRQYP